MGLTEEVETITAYELRHHLTTHHGIRMTGADYGTLLTVHDIEHRPGTAPGHEHSDGPNEQEWARDCADFGCGKGTR